MADDFLADLLFRIDQLDEQIKQKSEENTRLQATVEVLNRRIEESKFREGVKDLEQRSASHDPAHIQQTGYKTPGFAFFRRMVTNKLVTIQFASQPEEELPALPELGRDLSIRSSVSLIISHLEPLQGQLDMIKIQKEAELSVLKTDYDGA